ncbi:class I SAM-dependent rRNA methyltransferase [Desulfothermobacter acidiphilus]|uniref:class I SAM-dependent rRNA methyltransferase n=1 Tax=Desulfothermobacter acidiphilus TaxID=1938353 RepID=UPI003F8B782F
MARIILRPGKEKRLLAGHLWVYAGEIQEVCGAWEPGEIAALYDARGRFLGKGYFNPASQIAVRLLTREDEPVGADFFRRRLTLALDYRRRVVKNAEAYRLVNGEGDFLPGLVVDRYGDYIVLQLLTLGMERFRSLLVSLLQELLVPKGIYERSEGVGREREGLLPRSGPLSGEVPSRVVFSEGNRRFVADLYQGQKTGFFLDQRENRQLLSEITAEMRVLDCFCYTGGFAVAAAAGGAREVLAVDISAEALELAQQNARLNGLEDKIHCYQANAFDELRRLVRAGEQFDLVILDPPAFTKSKEALPSALRGYKEINLRALKLLRPGGWLFTCSCSYHLREELFWEMVLDAARDARRTLRLAEFRRQARDHTILPSVPETYYLKGGLFQII